MSSRPGELSTRIWSRAAYGYGVILGLGLAYFLIRMPYQVSDDLEHILIAQSESFGHLLVDRFTGVASVRPVMWLQQKVIFDMAPAGRLFAAYKAFHAVQLLV